MAGQQWLEQQQQLLQAAGLAMQSRQSEVEGMHAEAEARLGAGGNTEEALESRSLDLRTHSPELAQSGAPPTVGAPTLQLEVSRADELPPRLPAAAPRG